MNINNATTTNNNNNNKGRVSENAHRYYERELEYRIPRLHSPVNSRRSQEISEIPVRTKQASCRYSWKSVFSRLLP